MGQEDVDLNDRIYNISCQLQQMSWSPLLTPSYSDDVFKDGQLDLLMQAQALLTKNILYQKIDAALQRLTCCSPGVYVALQRAPASPGSDSETVSTAQRDAVVGSLRFLNIFFNFHHDTFAHAVLLLDSVLGKVQVHPKFLSTVATCCLYIAIKANEPPHLTPNPHELLVLSQTGGTLTDLFYTERIIYDLLGSSMIDMLVSATPLSFLRLFHEIVVMDCDERSRDKFGLAALINKMEVISSQFESTRFRADVLALALLTYRVQDVIDDISARNRMLVTLAELQYYCQINTDEFNECQKLISSCITQYRRQPTRLPRLRLSWSISKRTLHKMKPSTRAAQDLEPIMEDDVIGQNDFGSDGDSSPFDSEMDDNLGCKEAEADNCDLCNGEQ